MRFKALLAAVCALSVQTANAQVLLEPTFTTNASGNGQLNKTGSNVIIYYDFSKSDFPIDPVYWDFRIGGEAGPGGPIDSFSRYFLVDPADLSTVTGRIVQPFGLYEDARGYYNWRLSSYVPATFSVGVFSVGSVPEPSTWAILILGFGIIGFAMRRKSRLNPLPALA